MTLSIFNKANLDVLHVTSPDSRIPLKYQGKVVCTFRNLSVYYWPDLLSRADQSKAKYNRKIMVEKSDIIITASKIGCAELEKNLKIRKDKIRIIKNGIDEQYFKKSNEASAKIAKYLATRYKIKKEYILFVGTINPIKNIARLLEIFWQFKDWSIKNDNFLRYQLVISGKKGWLWDKYAQLIKDFVLERDVIFLGYVEEKDLKKILSQASLFIMPSLYESSGARVLAAMASGIPCLVSDIDFLKELTEGAVEFMNPFDVLGSASKLEALLKDEKRKADLIKRGRGVAKKYSWNKCAEETLKLYGRLRKKS